jgi:ATP-dependent Clp protease protease subunit
MLKNKSRNSLPKNIQPVIFERTKDGEMLYDVYSRLQKERIIFLSEEINADVGTAISATLLWLDHQSDKDISLYINTNGGSVSDGLFTIYDTMQYIKSPVQTVVIGEAYSAGAVILAAGTPGKRMAFPNAEIMLHELQSEVGGSGSEIAKESKRLQRMADTLYEIVSRHTGQTVDKIKDDCSEDFFLTAKEALAYGLIDKIVKPTKELLPLKPSKRQRTKRA